MNYKYPCLLAKRSRTPDTPLVHETLAGHILEVIAVTKSVVHSWGDAFLASTGLPQSWNERLFSAALRGAFLHDIGKTNHQFQRLVRQGPSRTQALRHEWISLHLLLYFPELDRWLFPKGDDLVRRAALCAIVGHHLEIPDGSALCDRGGSGDAKVMVMTSHQDVTDLLHRASKVLNLPDPVPVLTDLTIDLLDDDPLSCARSWIQETKRWWDEATLEERRFIAMVKVLVIAADVAGSVLPRTGADAAAWVKEVLSRTCQSEEIQALAMRGLQGEPLRQFQVEVAQTPSRITLVRAGCGSGKTTAAYLWAERNAVGRKLFFCYPTTGTATEGYADYILPNDIDAALIHSRAEVDLADILMTPDDVQDQQVRIEALAAWDVPLVVCTADTVLGLIQNNRRSLYSFPAIANGTFVFDEIHAYDDRMFGALLRFLEAFCGVPILLMTASLPQARLKVLRDVVVRLGEYISEIKGSRELETIPRYRLNRCSVDDVWKKVEEIIVSGGKVLWVANTVDRAVKFGKEALDRGLNPVLPYHSRYRYCDRIERHRAVIAAFKNGGPVIAVTTQVCEVSLNLSADILVTDLAPVPALIQRLGRLNRYVTVEKPGQPRTALVLEPEMLLPYEDIDLQATRKWLNQLGTKPVSQVDLAQAFLEVVGSRIDTETGGSAWLDGGPFSAPAPLREAGASFPVIRAEDASLAKGDRSQVARLSIPMLLGPVSREISSWPRIGVARIAPPMRIDYSEKWGAAWRK